jgi:two-component system, OmpR family, sensor histidine kinase BaeS
VRLRARLAATGLGARLALAFAAVAIGTAVAIAVATPPIVGRGFAAMQAQASGTSDPSSTAGSGAGRGMGPRAGQGVGLGPGSGMGPGSGAYLAQAQQETTTTIIVVAGVAAIVASLLGWVIARRVARPLERLETAAAAVARGDLGARSGIADRADEIGSLGRSFDAMAADLERGEMARKRFFQDAAHEMKTPLAVIDATAAAILDGVYEHDDRHLVTIREQTRLLGRVVDDLRTISLAEAGALPLHAEPVAVAPLLDTIRASFAARAAASGVTLRMETAPASSEAPLIVVVDRDRLAQAIGALLDNAIRHSPQAGEVVLSAAPSPVVVLVSRRFTRITVEDEGPGVAEADLPHVFERFYQADPARDRTAGTSGLGLAIARAVVEAHGGTVGVENRAGGGARFWIDLPASAA